MTTIDLPPRSVITYTRHNCERNHRTFSALAKCIWPDAIWIAGYMGGQFATVSYCLWEGPTVMLWATEEDARPMMAFIDRGGCSHSCRRDHRIVRMVRP